MEQHLQIKGMHCQGCVASLTRALLSKPGVTTVGIELSSGILKLDFDETLIALPQIKLTIEEAGYDVVA